MASSSSRNALLADGSRRFISKDKKGNFKIKDLVLPELGTYVLSVENAGLSGILKTNLKLKAPKTKKQTIVEESEF